MVYNKRHPFDVTYGENLVQQNSIAPSAERQIKQI